MRFLILIWRIRITFPGIEILLHADDLDSAFRRILYSPEMAILFAYIFGPYLIIPVGQVFGSRSAPSFFSLTSDIRADLATTGSLVENFDTHHQAKHIEIPLPPNPLDLTPAIADNLNLPLSDDEQNNYHNATFVDDNGVCAVRDKIVSALHQSLVAAFLLFGWPWQDRRSSCMAEDKWSNVASYLVLFLGFYINSRTMTVTWPLYKRQALYADIQMALASPCKVTPRMTASIIGKVRSAGEIAPWGPYISFSVSDTLKKLHTNPSARYARGGHAVKYDFQKMYKPIYVFSRNSCSYLSSPQFGAVTLDSLFPVRQPTASYRMRVTRAWEAGHRDLRSNGASQKKIYWNWDST